MTRPVAQQILIDLHGLKQSSCLQVESWEDAFAAVSKSLGVQVISRYGHRFEAPAKPGLTAYFLLDASHLSVHTYAEEGKAAVDLFAVTNQDLNKVADDLLRLLGIDQDAIAMRKSLRRLHAQVQQPSNVQ